MSGRTKGNFFGKNKKKTTTTPGESKSKRKETRAKDLEKRLRIVNWKDLSFVGTELANMTIMKKDKFEFPDLIDLLSTGELSSFTHPVYLFMISEPIYLRDERIVNVPVVVAYSSAIPPPDLVCHDSVQSVDAATRALNPLGGRPYPMAQEHLRWVPYVPERLKAEVASSSHQFIPVTVLDWIQRSARTKKFNEEQVHHVEYLNPFIIRPQVCENLEKPEPTSVTFQFSFKLKDGSKKEFDIVFDRECDRLREKDEDGKVTGGFLKDFLEKNPDVADGAEEALEAAIREEFKKARALATEQFDELMKMMEKYNDAQKKALREAMLYKIYPRHPDFDLTPYCSPRVNRYYGNADKVIGGAILDSKRPHDETEEDQ